MNLVNNILDMLPGDAMSKLGSLVDADSETTADAVRAAVPALLTGLSSVASRADGANKLTSALSQLGGGGFDDYASMLGGDANALASNGTNLLSSLFGDGLLSSVVGAVSKYVSLDSGTIKRLFAFLAPLVIGKVGSLWKSRGGSPQALTSLFAEQRDNIVDAMPAGLSLSDIPGWSASKPATAYADSVTPRRPVTYQEPAKKSPAAWAVPLALGLLGAFLIWAFTRGRGRDDVADERPRGAARDEVRDEARETTAMRPVLPAVDAAGVTAELRGLYTEAESIMASITDAASADAARPKLEELSARIDAARELIVQLPEAGRTTLKRFADENLTRFKRQAETAMETPSLGAEVKGLITSILKKLSDLFLPA